MSAAKDVLERAVEAFNAKDEQRFLSLARADVDLPAPGGLNFHGRDGFRQWYGLWTEAFPDRKVRYYNLVGDHDQVIGEGTFTGHAHGRHAPPIGGRPTDRQECEDRLRRGPARSGWSDHLFAPLPRRNGPDDTVGAHWCGGTGPLGVSVHKGPRS